MSWMLNERSFCEIRSHPMLSDHVASLILMIPCIRNGQISIGKKSLAEEYTFPYQRFSHQLIIDFPTHFIEEKKEIIKNLLTY